MKKRYIWLYAFICSCYSCEGNNDPIDNKPNQSIEVTYDKIITPPSISTIDESDYTIYYVDANTGNDTNNGMSEETPFRTLSKVTYMTKTPKMKVLLKSGSVFAENLVLKVVSEIHDPVTTTDELIPSGETSSYRSNPLGLAEFTLSRKDPAYVEMLATIILTL